MVPNLVKKLLFHLETSFSNPQMLFVSERRYNGQCSSFFPLVPDTQRLSKRSSLRTSFSSNVWQAGQCKQLTIFLHHFFKQTDCLPLTKK